jgi:hypothetical protein
MNFVSIEFPPCWQPLTSMLSTFCLNCELAISVCVVKFKAGLVEIIVELWEILVVPLNGIRIPDSVKFSRSNCELRLFGETQYLRDSLFLHILDLELWYIIEFRLSL